MGKFDRSRVSKQESEKQDKNKKKVDYKLIRRIGLLILAVCLVVGIIQFVNYVPGVKEAFVLATSLKPETFTELYFEDHLPLPSKVIYYQENNFKFTIHNLENQDMEYPYEVYIDINGNKQNIDGGTVFIENNGYQTISESFTITVSGIGEKAHQEAMESPTNRVLVRRTEIELWEC